MEMQNNMESKKDRLEEIARNYMTFGKNLTFHQYSEKVEAVTALDINQVLTKVLAGKPTVLVQGGAINLVPSITDVQNQLN